MHITKDEARILAAAITEFKYENVRPEFYEALTILEEKLRTGSKDQRRTGRTSQDDWADMLKRYTQKHTK
jgi:hypothetical protein